ncbi:MAG: Uma2 family endonuclease [Janthinobacterium lividum]
MATVLEKYKIQLPTQTMTYEEFLDWADEDTYAEWVDGKVEIMSPASVAHQDVSDFLSAILRIYTEDHDAGRVLPAPFQMRLSNVKRGREPDLLFVLKDNVSRLQRNYLDGPADLVIEIISPESVLRDRGAKYAEYEAGGVREYWIIDVEAKRADFFVLDSEGRYQRASADADGKYQSVVLSGFWVNLDWLWQSPLPSVRSVLKAWKVVVDD